MKKWLLRIFLGFLAVLALLFGIMFLRSLAPASVQDQELQLLRASIPQGSNAFDVLLAATNQIWWPEAQNRKISDLAKDTNWDDTLASTVLVSNREALASWDAATKLPDLQVPGISTADDLLPYLPSWKKLGLLAEIRENVLLHNGQDKEAFDQILDHVHLGQRMQNSRGVLIVYLVGTAVHAVGLNQMQHWVGNTHLSPAQLKNYILQLKPQPNEVATAFTNCIRVEHQMQINTLTAMHDGNLNNKDFPRYGFVWPMFSLSQTKELFTQGAIKLIEAAPHPYGEANIAELESRSGLASMALSGNWTGQILYYMMMPALANSLERKSRNDVQLQATRTILALRAYQLEHGNLPPDLNALVPEFLDAVPVDDFNGQPLRYSAEKKIVYSVGKNLKDDGGDDNTSADDSSQRRLNLVYKFDF